MQDHYCYYLSSSLTGISEEDCHMQHDRDDPVNIARPLFSHLSELLLDMMKECDKDSEFMSDYDNPFRQYGCCFQQQFCDSMNKTDPTNFEFSNCLETLFDRTDPTKCIGS
ncbi:unnamed protein product, partial [Rotaria sp. Silwood2]